MSGKLKEGRERPSLDLNDLARLSSTKDDIVLRIEEGIKLEEKKRREQEWEWLGAEAERRRRARRLALLAALVVLLPLLAGVYWWANRSPDRQPVVFNRPTPQAAPTGPPADSELINKSVNTSNDAFVLKRATLVTKEVGTHDVIIYDFHNNKFHWDDTRLVDLGAFDEALAGYRSDAEMRDVYRRSWVLIFAGASCEGTSDHNLTLTQERVKAVTRLINEKVKTQPLGYWGLRVGEYVKAEPEQLEWCKDGAHEPDSDKEKWLEAQRQLTLVIITPREKVQRGDAEDKMMVKLAPMLYEHNLLRDDYMYSAADNRAEPARIDTRLLLRPAQSRGAAEGAQSPESF